jgi:hypothetical protein
MFNIEGYYLLTDIGMLAKQVKNKPFLYFRDEGWKPDDDGMLGEYLFLGNTDYKRITEEEADILAKRFDNGEAIA